MLLLARVSIKNILTFLFILSISGCSQSSAPISLDAGSSAPAPGSELDRILSFSKDPTVLKYFGTQDAIAYGKFLQSVFDPTSSHYFQLMALTTADSSNPANGNSCKGIDGKDYFAGLTEKGEKVLSGGSIEYEITQNIDCEKKCYISSYRDRLIKKVSSKTFVFMEHVEENISLKECLKCTSFYDQPKELIDGKTMQSISEKVESEYCWNGSGYVKFFSKGESTEFNPKSTGHPLGCLSTPQFTTDPVTQYVPEKRSGESLVKYNNRLDDLYEAEWARLKCVRDLRAPDYNPVRP